MVDQLPTVSRQGGLTFILTPNRITVRTSLPQTFFLEPKAHYWKRRLNMIRIMIELGEIRNLNELAGWCGHGIEWVSTSNKYGETK